MGHGGERRSAERGGEGRRWGILRKGERKEEEGGRKEERVLRDYIINTVAAFQGINETT